MEPLLAVGSSPNANTPPVQAMSIHTPHPDTQDLLSAKPTIFPMLCHEEDLGSITGWEDPLEEGMATHSSILAWRIPMDR